MDFMQRPMIFAEHFIKSPQHFTNFMKHCTKPAQRFTDFARRRGCDPGGCGGGMAGYGVGGVGAGGAGLRAKRRAILAWMVWAPGRASRLPPR